MLPVIAIPFAIDLGLKVLAVAGLATAGYAIGRSCSDEEISSARREGARSGERKAKEQYEERFREMTVLIKDIEAQEHCVIALFSVAAAACRHHGVAYMSLNSDLSLLICGLSYSSLPPRMRGRIESAIKEAPNLAEAEEQAFFCSVSVHCIEAVKTLVRRNAHSNVFSFAS